MVDLVTHLHSILTSLTNNSNQLFTVRAVNDVKHTEIHTAEPLVREPSAFEFEVAIDKVTDTNR